MKYPRNLPMPTRHFAVSAALLVAFALSGCSVLPHKKHVSTPTNGNRVPVLSRIESGAAVDRSMASVAVILPPAETNAEWAQAGGSASKSYGHPSLGASPQEVWSTRIAGSGARQRLAASPVIGGGQLFVMDTNGMVHAYDASTGAEHWSHSFKVSGDGASSVYGGGVSYDQGRAYITTGVGEVAALDAKTGNQIWSVKPAGPLRGSPTISFGNVFVMTINNGLYALNAEDGKQLWAESGSQGLAGVFGVAAPAAAQGTVITGYSTGELVAYRYENGRSLWSDALSRTSLSTVVGVLTDIDADPIIDHGRVYALGQGGRMAAYELVSGQRIWELNVAGISTPAVSGDWIFALTDEGKLLCVAKSSGRVRWLTDLGRYANAKKKKGAIYWTGPVLAGGRLWLGNSRGQIVAANVEDGAVTEFRRVGSAITLAPVVAGNMLYVLDDSGKINAFR